MSLERLSQIFGAGRVQPHHVRGLAQRGIPLEGTERLLCPLQKFPLVSYLGLVERAGHNLQSAIQSCSMRYWGLEAKGLS